MRIFHTHLSTVRISNEHQTTTITTTSHQSHEMAVSLGPQGTLVTCTKREPIICELNIRDACCELAPRLSQRNETHLFSRASAVSLLKETCSVNPRLLYLDERAKFWSPPVSIGNELLHWSLLFGHVCNRRSE
jgi:hypothetical protein